MANEVFVLNEGEAIPAGFTTNPSTGTFNRNTSINPNVVTINGSSTTALGIHCYEIHSDTASAMGSGTVSSSKVNRLFPLNTEVSSYAENKYDSPNYRVIIDTGSADGIKEGSNLLGSSGCTRDYFIVIYADDLYKHHIAKITEESLYEGNFYKFDFTPSLKENITAGTKIAIYQGPVSTDNVVAVGYGLLNDINITEERHDKYVNVSKPTFYFYEGVGLEPNTKYTLLKTSTNSTGPQVSVFKTASQTSDYILDKSFFTHNSFIVDDNKNNDDDSQPKGINSYSAIGSNYTFDRETYSQSSLNIYNSDSGHNTYLQFINSPERTQLLSTPYHINTSKTVTNRGNQFEAKYYDTERMLEHKINDYEDIKIKEIIESKNISDTPNSVLPGIFGRKTSNTIEVTGLLDGQDLRTLLYNSGTGIWEPFLVDNYYYECAYTVATAITAPVDGVQTITISDSRAVTSNFWSGSASVHTFSDKKAYRKFFSRVTGTLLVGHEINTNYDGTTITRNGITLSEDESDIYNVEYSIQGTNYGRQLNVLTGDRINGYTTLINAPTSSYAGMGFYTSPLSGNLIVSKVVFEGKVESKETKIETTGAFKLSISGRDEISRLLGTPINRNYTYSREYVYSTFSPYNTNYTSTSKTISSISGPTITTTNTATGISFGDVLYIKASGSEHYYLLGAVKSVSGTSITLVKDSYITEIGDYSGDTTLSTVIYKANRTLLAGKTLDTSLRTLERATTLIGTADKGAVFTDGKYFNYSSSYSDSERLSSLGSGGTTNGIDIDNLMNTVNTSTQYYDSPVGFDFEHHTISSMVDFPVLNRIDLKDGRTQYEIGYVSPIVLGRIESGNMLDNFIEDYPLSNTETDAMKNFNIHLVNGQGLSLGGYLHLLNNELNADKSPKTFNNVFQDDPTYPSTKKGQYAVRFNTPIWRYANLSKSLLIKKKYGRQSLGNPSGYIKTNNDFYEKGSNFNFYASGYKANNTTIPVADYNADEVDSTKLYRKDLPTERTGIDPVVGAKSYLMSRYPESFHAGLGNYGLRVGGGDLQPSQISLNENYELVFGMFDNYSGPLHIFSVGDIYPESKKNPNNIGFTEGAYSRSLEDYSAIFKGQARGSNASITHTDWFGKSTIKNRLDDDYFYETIQTSSGEMNRCNLVRLTEVTYDYLFNEVDFESYIFDNFGTEETTLIHRTPQTWQTKIVKTFPESGFSPIDITLTADIPASGKVISVNSTKWYDSNWNFYLFTDPYSDFSRTEMGASGIDYDTGLPMFIGRVASVSTTAVTLVNDFPKTAIGGVDGYPSGQELYVIVTKENIHDENQNKLLPYRVHAGYNRQLPHAVWESAMSDDEEVTYNYNRTLALTNYGDGNDSDKDGSGATLSDTNKKPLNSMDPDADRLNSILLPNPFDKETYKTQSKGTLQPFLWKTDVSFSGSSMTITDGKILSFFKDESGKALGANFLTDVSNSFGTTTPHVIGGGGCTFTDMTGGVIRITNVDGLVSSFLSAGLGINDYITIAGATDATNNGEFLVQLVPSANQIRIFNPNFTNNVTVGEPISYGKSTFTEDVVIEIANAVGYNGNYKIVNLNNTSMTLHTDKSGTAATFTTAVVSDVVIKLYQSNESFVKVTEDIIPHRLLQETLDNDTLETSFGFNYSGTHLVIVSTWAGNSRIVPLNIQNNISGATYKYEPQRVINRTVNIIGKDYSGGNNTITKGRFIDYAHGGTGSPRGILEHNQSTGGNNFAGVTPVEVLFKPFIDVSDFLVFDNDNTSSAFDESLKDDERILIIDINTINMVRGVTQTPNHWLHYSNNLTGYYLKGEKLHKVISHTVSKDTTTFRHYLKIDNASGITPSVNATTNSADTDELSVLKLNQVCTYDFSPKKITLNRLSSEYTRKPNSRKMLKNSASAEYFTEEEVSDTNSLQYGVRSMYLMIQPDGGGGDYLLPRSYLDNSFTNSFSDGTHRVLFTDGVEELITEMNVTSGSRKIEFMNMKKMLGSPSIGSVFSITVNRNPSFEPETLSIGSPFNISLDSEDIADDILTRSGISYTKDTSADNYYIGSNFTGENAYTAINNVLSFKGKKLKIDGSDIKIISNEEEKEYRSIEFNENENTYKIIGVKKDKSLYDNFNNITVFGDGVKGTAKNYRNIKNSKEKIKEFFDYSLVTQTQVDKKAQQLLKLYTSLQSAVELEVGDKIPLLQPGNIISVYYPSEGIFRQEYMVLEIQKSLGSPTKLLLGQYNRDLANTFTMLISETRNLQGRSKQKVYTSVTSPNIEIQSFRLKFVRATITNVGATSSSTLGYTNTLGFNAGMGL